MAAWAFAALAFARPPTVEAPRDSVELSVQDVTPAGDGTHVVFLTDADHERIVPLEVAEGEAITIAFRLAGRGRERASTHDLLEDLVDALGGEVVQVHVHSFAEGSFQARVSVRRKRALLHTEARAVDGVLLALGAGLPVWMDRTLYETAGVTLGDLLQSLESAERGLDADRPL